MSKQNIPENEIEENAKKLAEEAASGILTNSGISSDIDAKLSDLKFSIAQKAVNIFNSSNSNTSAASISDDFLWDLAFYLPDFNVCFLHRLSAFAIASAVFFGWIAGGIFSGFLNLLDLGGDILRAACIFGAVWIEEYISTVPKARKRLLKTMGWLSLAGFAARVGTGIFRFASGGFLSSVFGAARPGFFKGIWLAFGAVFIFAFFSRKSIMPDAMHIKEQLEKQIIARLRFLIFVLQKLKIMEDKLKKCRLQQETDAGLKENMLVSGILNIFDSLTREQQAFLANRLELAGYSGVSANENRLIWDEDEHIKLYTPVGFIKNGDICIILKRPVIKDDKIIKGYVQKTEATDE